jgi:dCTP diphosphatase
VRADDTGAGARERNGRVIRSPALFPGLPIMSTHLPISTLEQLAENVREFGRERDWHLYHTPKNLTAALIVEAAELLEPFQWLTAEQSLNLPPAKKEAVRQEMADVLIYLVSLANCLEIDLLKAAEDKLAINAAKYPVEKARGSCAKSHEL